MSKVIHYIFITVLLSGCASNLETTQPSPNEEPTLSQNQIERISFLKDKAVSYGLNPNNLAEVDSMFSLMGVFQDARVSVEDSTGIMFFFRNPIGIDNGNIILSSFFQCTQVFPPERMLNFEGEEVDVYKAYYFNPSINLTVSVFWFDRRPLVGQKLNTDFLIFLDADTYTNSEGNDRSAIQFYHPGW